MAREKGTGNLQLEKSGRWTVRIGINGRRLSRSTGTKDRDKAEAFLNRFLAPMGLGATRLPLAEAWHHYEMSPNRRDLARSTLDSKRIVWMGFARWMEHNHLEIAHLAEVTETAVAEYLAEFRCHHSASTYNGHVCVLREIFRVLADKAGIIHDPWAGVCLRADDSISRRELSIDEVERLYTAASKVGKEWKLLLTTGIYTGMRLGDCCRLKWEDVHLDRGVIQIVPEKTKRHAHGKPVTIPIHPQLMAELQRERDEESGKREDMGRVTSDTDGFVNPVIADLYLNRKWQLDEGLRKIFKAAKITMSIRVEGRCRRTVIASFHSLRHTFVSLSANAGVPLPVVQSIVGHCSTAMTRHYYHENEEVLRQAVQTIPAIGEQGTGNRELGTGSRAHSKSQFPAPGTKHPAPRTKHQAPRTKHQAPSTQHPIPSSLTRSDSIAARLKRLDKYRAKGIVTEDEYAAARERILAEM